MGAEIRGVLPTVQGQVVTGGDVQVHPGLINRLPAQPLIQGKPLVPVGEKGLGDVALIAQSRKKLVRGGQVGLVQGYQGQGVQADDLLVEPGINGRVLIEDIPAGVAQGQFGLRSRGQSQGQAAQQAVAGFLVFKVGAGKSVEEDRREGDELLAVLGDLLFQVFPVAPAAEFAGHLHFVPQDQGTQGQGGFSPLPGGAVIAGLAEDRMQPQVQIARPRPGGVLLIHPVAQGQVHRQHPAEPEAPGQARLHGFNLVAVLEQGGFGNQGVGKVHRQEGSGRTPACLPRLRAPGRSGRTARDAWSLPAAVPPARPPAGCGPPGSAASGPGPAPVH